MQIPFERNLVFAGVTLLLLFPLGILGLLSPYLLWPIFALHLVFLFLANRDAVKSVLNGAQRHQTLGLLITTACIALLCIVMGLVPVTARDALVHHLALPKWWLESGSIHTFPWYDISYYPMLIQLAFLPLLQALPAQACALYHLLYLIPLAGSAAGLTRAISAENSDDGKTNASRWAFIITLTLPICLRLASEPLVDLALGAYCGVAVSLLIRRQIIGAVSLGLALCIKYNALPFALFTVLVAPLARVPIRVILKFALVAALIASPWFVRNTFEKGSPFYPLGAGRAGIGSIESRTLLYGESTLDLISTPITMLLSGADEDPRRFDGVLSPILLLAALAIWRFRHNRNIAALSLAIGAYFLVAQISSGARIRYLLPIIPVLCALTALGLSTLHRRVIIGVVCAHALFTITYLSKRLDYLAPVSFITTSETTSEYLAARLPEYSFVQQITPLIAPGEQVYLVLTGNRFFYLPFSAQAAGYLSGPELLSWLETSSVGGELKRRRCRYLLVNLTLFERLRGENAVISLGSRLDAVLKRIKQEGHYALFELPEVNESTKVSYSAFDDPAARG